jgi:hypothetical protein
MLIENSIIIKKNKQKQFQLKLRPQIIEILKIEDIKKQGYFYIKSK